MKNNPIQRSYTSTKIRLKNNFPIRNQQIQLKRQTLLSSYRQRQADSHRPNTQSSLRSKLNSTFAETYGRGFSHRIKSSGVLNKKRVLIKTSKVNNKSIYESQISQTTPLMKYSHNDAYQIEILPSMQKHKSLLKRTSSIPIQSIDNHTKYLKRGDGINKSILINVLKSKINKTVAQSGSNYSGRETNKQLTQFVRNQIPLSLKDVIGVQQMMRMSNIFTGCNFKYDDLYKKVNAIIQNRNSHYHQNKKPDEDEQTLKSIKRW